jgi:hypothetical protein
MNYKLTLAISCMLVGMTNAQTEPSFLVLLRQERSNKIYYTKKVMPDLIEKNSFDGKYFKIVKGKSNEAVSFDEQDKDILLKAANVYYHLSQARDFWVNQMDSQVAANFPKTTIRLDISNQFDDLGHFAHDNRTPQYNNALSVPAGETPSWVPASKQDKWGKEIWFRPLKSIPTKELGPMGPNPLTVSLSALERPLINYTQNQFNHRLMEEIFYPAYVSRSIQQDVIRYAGTYAVMKIIIYGSKMADPLFVDKFYYLDTAMIPEIIYHEYAHLILSDNLEMSHSTSVNEGMADYFAAVLSKKRKIYAKVPRYSNSAPKDTQEKKKYSHWDESNRNATADFTLSVLWDVRETLGEEIGDKVVYEARKFLKTETSTISDGLLRAILAACDVKCEMPRRDKYKLYKTFAHKGF